VTLRIEDNEIRVLPGHVAINAVAVHFMIPLWKGVRARLVAGQTTLRKSLYVVLNCVHVMAS
jgi:hypothetical protein